MRTAEFTHYQFMATLDRRTCSRCGERDGEVYKLSEMNQGENAPPMHARCRCTIVAYDGLQYGTRAARDFGDSLKGKSVSFDADESGDKKIKTPFGEVNGTKVKITLSNGEVVDHYRRVPADMSYRDWKAIYIDKTKSLDTWQAEFDARRQADENSALRQRGRQVIEDLAAGRLPTTASGGKVGLAAGNVNLATTQGTPPKLIGKLESVTPAAIQKTLEYYEAKIVNAPIEHGIIITTAGEIYHCTGDLNTLPTIVELGEKLRGAYVTHNHPVGSDNEYTFSESDCRLFTRFNLEQLRGIDERFIYELNRNSEDIDNIVTLENADEYTFRHGQVVDFALTKGFGYRRWLR